MRELVQRVWREIGRDDVFGQAAKLAFYFLLALVPFLLFVTTLLGYVAQSTELRDSLLEYFRRVVPRSAFRLLVDTLNEIASGAGSGKLSIGIVGTLWAASNGLAALSEGLNAAYGVRDERPWWKARAIAVLLTIAFSIFTAVALVLIVAGAKIGTQLAGYLALEDVFVTLWGIARWPIALLFVLTAVDLVYHFAPDLEKRRWKRLTPGALIAVWLWLLVSFGFRTYLRYFNSYTTTYGSLGAVVILMLWFYLTAAAVLIGAEVNAEIENAAARAGHPDARPHGEKSPIERQQLQV